MNSNMNARTEVGQLITKLWEAGSDAKFEEIAEKIGRLSPDPHWSEYVYYSEEYVGGDGTLLLEELLDRIFAYKPVVL